MRYRFKNATVLLGGVFHLADVFVADGRIVSIGDRISCPGDTVSIDLHKAFLFPGFVDVHVHLREPGFSYKETIRTGTMAAAHGGFTHVAAMPNLDPVPDCRAALALQQRLIAETAAVHVHPYGAVTVGEQGERLADLAGMAPDVIAFSDDGRGIQSESIMRQGKYWQPTARTTACCGAAISTTGLTPAPTATGASARRANGAPSPGMCVWRRRPAARTMCAMCPPKRAWPSSGRPSAGAWM